MKMPYMPFYVIDYMSDQNVTMMSLAAQGLYIRILLAMWMTKKAYLPVDSRKCARLAGVPYEEFLPAWEELWNISDLFMLSEDEEEFTQKRLRAEWLKATAVNSVRKEAQQKSVASRKNAAEVKADEKQAVIEYPEEPSSETEDMPDDNFANCKTDDLQIAKDDICKLQKGDFARHISYIKYHKDLKNYNARSDDCATVPRKVEYAPEFELFWAAYPRWKEKSSAYKQWLARIKSGVPPEAMIQAANLYAEECRAKCRAEEYIKQAKTFLGSSKPYEDYLHPPGNPAAMPEASADGAIGHAGAEETEHMRQLCDEFAGWKPAAGSET